MHSDFKWHFQEHRPGDKVRNPIQGEFFTHESISNPGEALVREGIQNSLDARRDDSDCVTVYMRLADGSDAVPAAELQPFTEGLFPHISARKNGLETPPKASDPCSFLVFEDYGTTGLQGDPQEWQPSRAEGNDFFNFFRAEGLSDKGEKALGRWGVGKFVFHLASNASTLFGYTVRADDGRSLLMGNSVLKNHEVEGMDYVPDGWFGHIDRSHGLVAPIDDKRTLERFRNLFQLLAREDKPGLSVVVPWYDKRALTDQNLIRATLRGYFWPILQGKLEVWVQTSSFDTIMKPDTLCSELKKFGGDLENEILPLVKLSTWAQELDDQDFTIAKPPTARRKPEWTEDLFTEEQLAHLRSELAERGRIAVRVPATVRRKGTKKAADSYFDVFISKDECSTEGRPVFIREGIIIPDIRCKRTRGFRSLVIADDRPLATLLGDAENPAHTQWRADTRGFKDKYVYAPGILEFVKHSVHEIMQVIHGRSREIEPNLLSHLFSIKVPTPSDDSAEVQVNGGDPGVEPQQPPAIDVETPPPSLRIRRTTGGFVVSGVQGERPLPAKIIVEAAYLTRRGNPFRRYSLPDFDFDKEPMTVSADDADILLKHANRVELSPLSQSYRLVVTGFDGNRDLKIRVKEQETGDAK